MKRILLAGFCLFVASAAHAGDEAWRLGFAEVLCSSICFTATANSVSCWNKRPIFPGETLIGIMGANGSTTMNTPSDPSANFWTVDQTAASGINASFAIASSQVRYFVNVGSTYTFIQAANTPTRIMALIKVSGIYGAVVDSATAGNGTVVGWTSANLTGTQSDGFMIGGAMNGANGACSNSVPNAGEIELVDLANANNDCLTVVYRIVSTIGANAISGTYDGSSPVMRSVAAQYKAAGRRID